MDLEGRRVALRGRGGIRLAADCYGDPAARTVALLHGGGQTRHAWVSTARCLAASGYHAVTVDLRGHGESDWAVDADYSLEAFAGDLVAIAERFETSPAFVGASLGGLAALLLEGEVAPGTAAAVVLVDVGPRLEPAGVTRIVSFMTASPDGFASLDEAADTIAAYLPNRPRPADLSGLAKNLRRGADGRYRWHWDPAFLMGGGRPSAAADSDRLFRAASRLEVPTLLVRGRESDTLSEEAAMEFLAVAPAARYVSIAGARHMVAGDRNDIFADAVITFLDQALGDVRTMRKRATS